MRLRQRRLVVPCAAMVLLIAPSIAHAQQVLIDRGVQAAGLWCFPIAAEPNTYVYLPAAARLSSDEAGKPLFSFVRYIAAGGAGSGPRSIRFEISSPWTYSMTM